MFIYILFSYLSSSIFLKRTPFLTRYKSFFLYCYKACASLFNISYRITIEWPPRSPDLTPCDFSSWGIIKDRVYAKKSRDLNHLKILIKEEFTLLNDNIWLVNAPPFPPFSLKASSISSFSGNFLLFLLFTVFLAKISRNNLDSKQNLRSMWWSCYSS